jgi:carbonic anhydrase/acetyltransferase-like protein (isoleucine patch superfamily)
VAPVSGWQRSFPLARDHSKSKQGEAKVKAILWSTRAEADLMAPILDRPFIQHVVEQLVTRGVERIDVISSGRECGVQALLGEGARWGIEIAISEGGVAESCGTEADYVLVGDLACLPSLPDVLAEEAWPVLFFHDRDVRSYWTGWAILRAQSAAKFVSELAAGAPWRTALTNTSLQVRKTFLDRSSLSTCSAADIIEANRIALDGRYPGLYYDAVEQNAGIWIARGAKVPPTAVLQAPCYIGQNAWIGAGCRIGPNAVIGSEAVVEKGTEVSNSVVAAETYIGPELRIADSIVRGNEIHNVRLGTRIEIEEDHVVSSVASSPLMPAWMKLIFG